MSQPYRDHPTGDAARYSNPDLDDYFDGSIPVRPPVVMQPTSASSDLYLFSSRLLLHLAVICGPYNQTQLAGRVVLSTCSHPSHRRRLSIL